MRTTLEIDDDVLAAAKVTARAQSKAAGAVVSELARNDLRTPAEGGVRNGVPLLTINNPVAGVGLDVVNALRDEAP